MSVRIVTDSTAYLPADVAASHDIAVVPLHVVVGGSEHSEGSDITPAQVASALRDYTVVTTSRPTPQVFLETYRRLAHEGADQVVSIHLSSQMSGTVESARLAARESPVPVHVIDSETLGMAMGFAVVAAAEVAGSGGDLSAVVSAVTARLEGSTVLFYVDTLEHLRRGGRIGAASAMLGSALAIKPILAVRGGRIVPVEKVRTSSRAIARIQSMVLGHVNAGGHVVDIAVHHLDAADRAEALAGELRTKLPGAPKVMVVELGAVVGAHVGPGTLAIALSPRPDEPLPEATVS
ncbi:fatty acid-binding protein DegV [Humibacillus sp. DSM 29435]|uniref:DegV family protein n=1 Tax=Humibacillus sp. DSM 29435 TaxID=1869167 RepID=UPI000871F924|nr:DegV family protein [Humibacillus sp. DSM 29435]OFE16405.1 fatty acid-binding protein DegV [Humibacillus sp. DSM 29435]